MDYIDECVAKERLFDLSDYRRFELPYGRITNKKKWQAMIPLIDRDAKLFDIFVF